MKNLFVDTNDPIQLELATCYKKLYDAASGLETSLAAFIEANGNVPQAGQVNERLYHRRHFEHLAAYGKCLSAVHTLQVHLQPLLDAVNDLDSVHDTYRRQLGSEGRNQSLMEQITNLQSNRAASRVLYGDASALYFKFESRVMDEEDVLHEIDILLHLMQPDLTRRYVVYCDGFQCLGVDCHQLPPPPYKTLPEAIRYALTYCKSHELSDHDLRIYNVAELVTKLNEKTGEMDLVPPQDENDIAHKSPGGKKILSLKLQRKFRDLLVSTVPVDSLKAVLNVLSLRISSVPLADLGACLVSRVGNGQPGSPRHEHCSQIAGCLVKFGLHYSSKLSELIDLLLNSCRSAPLESAHPEQTECCVLFVMTLAINGYLEQKSLSTQNQELLNGFAN